MNSRFKLVVVTSSTFLVVLLLLGAVMGKSASPDDAYRHLAVYTEVLGRIKSEYVEEPDMKNVTLGAMNGMLEAIDPFASYLSADQYNQWVKSSGAARANVGLILSRRFGYVGVVSAIPGSAAARAGLSTGDMLESINDVATRDMPLAYAEMLLEGEPGSTVHVSVLRVRKPEPQKMSLTRGVIRIPQVTSKMLPDQIALIQIPAIDSARVKDVATQLDSLVKQGAKKAILDLRFSAVGRPDEGIGLANLFIDKGLITYVEGQKMKREDHNADAAKAVFKSLPLIVLTNRGTASGAEVAAAALLDSKRAELVGERTYGDAAIRKAVTMDDGSAVILSVAKYYAPNGKAIQDNPITPTYLVSEAEPEDEVEGEVEAEPAPRVAPAPPVQPPAPATTAPSAPSADEKKDEDPILKRAIELLTKGASVANATPASAPSRTN